MPTAMAIVLLEGFCWLKPETSLAELGSRVVEVECHDSKPCWKNKFLNPLRRSRGGAAPRSLLPSRGARLDGRNGTILKASLFQYWDDHGVLLICQDVNSGNRDVEELRQEGYAARSQATKVEHGELVRLGGGGARFPNGRSDTSHVDQPV